MTARIVYLVGGAPRVGKSSLAQHLLALDGIPWLPTDVIRTVVRRVAPDVDAVDQDPVDAVALADSIESAPGRKIRYRCPHCTSTGFKYRSTRQLAFRCAACATEFDVRAEEELTVQVFTANYSCTWRPADRPFPEEALDPAYLAKAQQHAIRRLDVTQLRPILEAHLVTGEPWWGTQVREDERIPGGHSVSLSKTRLGSYSASVSGVL